MADRMLVCCLALPLGGHKSKDNKGRARTSDSGQITGRTRGLLAFGNGTPGRGQLIGDDLPIESGRTFRQEPKGPGVGTGVECMRAGGASQVGGMKGA